MLTFRAFLCAAYGLKMWIRDVKLWYRINALSGRLGANDDIRHDASAYPPNDEAAYCGSHQKIQSLVGARRQVDSKSGLHCTFLKIAERLRAFQGNGVMWEELKNLVMLHYDVLKDFSGPGVALIIAYFGFRSFRRWKKEQLEERRMEVAFQALKLAYQSTYVFEHIRSPLIEAHEWRDMPISAGDDSLRSTRGSYYAISKRIEANKEFFRSVWEIQPACMAMFGPKIEETFLELHRARRAIEVACQMLYQHASDVPLIPDPHKELWEQLRADIAGDTLGTAKEGDRVGRQLTAFRIGIERACGPIVKKRRNRLRLKWWEG